MDFLDSDRLLADVLLEPIQGCRFQPTGFPSLGPAEFTSIDSEGKSVNCLLVESAQSMANNLEIVCWDKAKNELVEVLEGMPLITVKDENGHFLTNSLLEAHRINSAYMLETDDKTLKDKIKEELEITEKKGKIAINLARFVFKYDPNSILHGFWLSREDIAVGRCKMTRSLSSFIEAENVKPIVSGGVKFDHVDPKGGEDDDKKRFGHIPYSRTEYSAESIKAYFNIDLALIKSYGLGDVANEFLQTLALWKIRSFLQRELRLRSSCDLKVKEQLKSTYPESVDIPDLDSLGKDLKKLIEECKNNGLFTAEPLDITYKKSKKPKNPKQDED